MTDYAEEFIHSSRAPEKLRAASKEGKTIAVMYLLHLQKCQRQCVTVSLLKPYVTADA